ncbi:ATP-grasp domain-containing protein [Paraburkholderia sp.]|uniref:ATP-grasp domain-containing protein n=1 Tax=Paraburkholderia sp. TaxID=1926495 RepID=UPI003D6DBADE
MIARPSLPHAPFVAVAGLSARMLAQSAVRAGLRVAALDLFGDRDTRAASDVWFDIGGEGLTIDPTKLAGALERVARLPRLIGWIGGSGLEPCVAALRGAQGLPPFIGNDAAAEAAVRDPRRFFALLDTLGVPHPEVSFTCPAEPDGWLQKRANGCGGMQVEDAREPDGPAPPADTYFQRLSRGRPLSALFVGARGHARVIGFAEQLTCTLGDLRFVHAGSIGPIDVPPRVDARMRDAIDALCANTGLTGINSCDFLLDGDAFELLEINARPSATMALYEAASPRAWPRGLLACHLDACRLGRLPPPETRTARSACAGQQVLFAPVSFTASQAFSDACLRDPRCRDVPMPGTHIVAGQPVCTLFVDAASPDTVRHALERQRALVLQRIETCHETDHAPHSCPA